MPVMRKTEYSAQVVWLGHVPSGGSLRARPVDRLDLDFAGETGARHAGVNRASCMRMKNLYPEDTEIRNVRQLTILSSEELDEIASEMGLETLDPTYLGASMVLKGIPDFTHIPPSSRLQAPDGLTMTVDMENRPCIYPGKEIESDIPGYGKTFKPAAKGRRGVTAWIERPGTLKLNDSVSLFVPDQRAWEPL
ncbi:MOSC domain-containing protein [Ruegeria atlantica]|uniref:MOSC domain-containing protein n=1 Tax=Ruegeria atlantica TaxID=81569 RepID=UPI001480F780|nr:sulfurase [Ruegeria atlantica]